MEESKFNQKVNSLAQDYLDLASKIARGEKGVDKYDLITLAEQHGKELEQMSKDYKLAEGKNQKR